MPDSLCAQLELLEGIDSQPVEQPHIRNVSKTYPNGVEALKDVTLTIIFVSHRQLMFSNGSNRRAAAT
jgi:hypothetical protein